MKAVVTGGAGFIGSQIVDALLADGAEVLVVDDFSTGQDSNLESAKAGFADKLQVVKKDICDKSLADDFSTFKPEVIFHTAAQINVRRSVAEPAFDSDKNVSGTVNLLESGRLAGAKRFIFSSTGGAIYGEQEYFPADEVHPNHPESQYGVSKKAAELYLEFYARVHNLTTVSLRYSNVFGPRQNPHGEAGVVAIFTERLLAGESLRVNGDGEQTRDFVYVGDVVSANLKANTKTSAGEFSIYNVGTGVESSVLEIVAALKNVWPEHGTGSELKVEHGPALPGEQKRSVIDSSKLSKEFGWTASVELEEGLVKTVKSFVKK